MIACPQCGQNNPDGTRYCLHCAAALSPKGLNTFMPPTLAEKIQAATSVVVGQRREVTVLILDIHYPTNIAERSGEEQMYLQERELTQLLAEAIYEYEGHIDNLSSHGMMALFGAPVMHENHAERAIRTAVSLQKQFHSLQLRLQAQFGSAPEIRIGINTGPIIIGAVGSALQMNYTVVGNTVNLGQTLAQLATPGAVLLSESTYKLTNPIFHFRQLSPVTNADQATPFTPYELLGIRQKPGQVRGLPGMQAPMVGRDAALTQLQNALNTVSRLQQQHIAVVLGDAGVGKSRFLLEFRRSLANADHTKDIAIYEGRCEAHTRSRPFGVISHLLRCLTGINQNDLPTVQLSRLTVYLERLDLAQNSIRPFMAYLLGIHHIAPEIEAHLALFNADMLRKSIHTAVRRVLLASASQETPTILIFEDLHWIDPASGDLLRYFCQTVNPIPLLFILVSRETPNDFLGQTAIPTTTIQLQTLSPAEGQQMVDHFIPQTTKAAQAIKAKIIERSAGNPFYTEEFVRMLQDGQGLVWQNKTWQVTPQAEPLLQQVPGNLQALILARFDNLEGPLQTTLQKAAILSRGFSTDLFQAICDLPLETMTINLHRLVERQFLVADSAEEGNFYTFRHTIVQDAIYQTLLRRDRKKIHGQIAQAIEQQPTLPLANRNELLAHHYSRSAQPAKAIPYLLTLADEAARRFTNELAVQYYQQTLSLLAQQKIDTSEIYFRAKIGLGQSLKFLGQYSSANEILSDALQGLLSWSFRAKPISLLNVLISGLREMADIQLRESNYSAAIAYLEAGIEALGDSGIESYPHLYSSLVERTVFVRFRQGELDEAFDLAQIVLTNISPDSVEAPVILANLYNTLGGISWQQGNLETAIRYVEESLKRYEHLSYLWGIANAYSNLGVLYAQLGNWPQTINYWQKTLALRQEIGDIQNQTISLMNLGQLRLSMGDHVAARKDLEKALAVLQNLNDTFGIAWANASLGRVALEQGQLNVAENHAQIALELADEIQGTEIQIEARWVKALIHAHQNKLQEGTELASQALQMAKETGLTVAQADCLRTLGVLYKQADNYFTAEMHLRESVELCRQINDPYRHALALFELSDLYQRLLESDIHAQAEWHSQAAQSINKAVRIFSDLGAKHNLAQAKEVQQRIESISLHSPSGQREVIEVLPDKQAGERHTAVILWLNLKLPAAADEEDTFEIMAFTLPACATIAQEYGGQVRQRPNGLTVIFGVPTAYENDTEQAVRTAHHILQYLQETGKQLEHPLTVQITVSRGAVLTSKAVPQTDFTIHGQSLERAEKVTQLTPPDLVWVTESVRAATERLFVYQPEPLLDIPLAPLWSVAGLQEAPSPARGLPGIHTRFIGREASLQAMLDLSHQLNRKLGGIIWIEGEAGIGKSRLMREFKTAVPLPNALIWSGKCLPQRTNHAFSLFSDLLNQAFNLKPEDSSEQIRRKIEQVIQTWPYDAQVTQPYLEMLVGVRPTGLTGERLNKLAPEQLRQQTFVAIRRLLKTLAKQHPLLIFLDDLHWIDSISAELLNFIATMVATDAILLVCAQRREGSDSPNDRLVRLQSLLPGQTVQLTLDRLPPELSQILLGDLLPGANLPADLRQTIIARSEGNPYFLEEFVRMFIELGYVQPVDNQWQIREDIDLDVITIPSSLETLIRSRVDALPEDLKYILQCASIIGQEFDLKLLEAITRQPDTEVSVKRVASRLMFRATAEADRWEFSHALFQSVVYDTMLPTHRKALHLQAAAVLKTRLADFGTNYAKELAHHYLMAGEQTQALPYLIQAGEWAAQQFAGEEALLYFQEAAEIMSQISRPDEKWQWQLAVGLGDVYRFTGQYEKSATTLEAGLALVQATELDNSYQAALFQRLGETLRKQGNLTRAEHYFKMAQNLLGQPDDPHLQREIAHSLTGLAWVYFAQGKLEEAREICEKSLACAQGVDDLNALATTENLLGGIYYQLGKWRDAFHHTTRAMVLREQMGYSWGVAATLSNLGILAFVVGHWEKAISFFERSLALRQEMGDVEGGAITQNNLGNAYRGQGKAQEAEPHFRQSIETAKMFNISYHFANSSVGLAHVILWQGRLEEAQEILETGLQKAEEIGAQDVLAEAYRVQAELLLAQNKTEQALTIAHQAAKIAATVGNRSYEAASWRIASEAALQQNNLPLAYDLIGQAQETLTDVTDDLESGHIMVQAYRICRLGGQDEQAEANLLAAREIFTRLDAHIYLKKLEEEMAAPT